MCDGTTHKDIKFPVSTLRNHVFTLANSLGHGHIKLDEIHVAKLCQVLGFGATAHPCKDVKIMLKEDLRESPADTARTAACDQDRLLLNR